ncbi:hypothetical protein KEJ21_03250 [Candidatus Bathyarchaeota archaeon]|nr:hypothetical protein [Candidatus Bathyarchaeota archaeon]MBS7630483.1 hypothetical protein [Candidatus Bathyarchaeota archaeon]
MKRIFIYSNRVAENPSEIIDEVIRRIEAHGILTVVVASANGGSALKLAEALSGKAKVIGVTEFTYDSKVKKNIIKLKGEVVEKADLPIQDRKEMRETLLSFGAGVKAALEVAVIAAERGLVSEEKIIAASGGGGLVDTVLVVKPSTSKDMLSPDSTKRLKVLEFVVMPSIE